MKYHSILVGYPDYNSGEVLSKIELDLPLFNNPDNVIPFDIRSRLIQHCVHKTNYQHFDRVARRAFSQWSGMTPANWQKKNKVQ